MTWLILDVILILILVISFAINHHRGLVSALLGIGAVVISLVLAFFLSEKLAEPIYEELSKYFNVDYDAAGSIGKRYRREDEIGTPFSICVDFDTAEDGCVTVRDRDTMEQVRIPVSQVRGYIEERLLF